MDIWLGAKTRGPVDRPCTSSSNHVVHTCPVPRRSANVRHQAGIHGELRRSPSQQHLISTSASAGYRAPAPEAHSASARPQRMVTISYEEETSDDVLVPAPPGGKTLKINVDLMLWRCRQARLKAQLSLDEVERRELMKEAEAGLRRCLVLDPADARTYVVLGKLLMMQKRFDEARALYAQGVANTGNMNAYIWSAWGWLEFKTGNTSRARQLFDAATVVDNTHACAWHKWGLLERSEGNYLRARDLWMQGIQRCKRKPQSQNAYLFNALAVMAAELKRVSEARAWFDEGTSTVEGAASVALWQAWAVLEANQGDPTAVRYLFKKALKANPKSRYVHLAWALWERKCGNLVTCKELLQRGCELNPTDAALYQARALLEWREHNNAEKARVLFDAGLRADPGHVPLWQAWGCMESQLGEVDHARRLFQKGVWADPRSKDTVWVLHAWGCLERNQDNLPLARELFKAAIKVDPKAEKVWFTWIAMEADAGQVERADELRIRQAEQQWEFEVPAGFTTRPGGSTLMIGGQGVPPFSPLAALRDTLANFFTVRNAGMKSPPSRPSNSADANTARSFLPADFTGDISLDDVLPNGIRSSTSNGNPSAGQQLQQQRQGQKAAGADAAAVLLGQSLNGDVAQAQAELMSVGMGIDDDGLEGTIKPPPPAVNGNHKHSHRRNAATTPTAAEAQALSSTDAADALAMQPAFLKGVTSDSKQPNTHGHASKPDVLLVPKPQRPVASDTNEDGDGKDTDAGLQLVSASTNAR